MGHTLTLLVLTFAVATAGHALLYKRDSRAAIAWVAFIMLVPVAGAVAYWLLGINRVRRLAAALRPHALTPGAEPAAPAEVTPALQPLAALGDRVSPFAVCSGNAVSVLDEGNDAFPAMLDAIAGARHTIALSTYIFGSDESGRRFADALADAHRRGVRVRVLVDAIGLRYSRSNMVKRLQAGGVPAAAFLPVTVARHLALFNLRNHRKVLIADGRTAYIGGLNLRGGHGDLQFEVRGPVVAQLTRVFADDWNFTTGELLDDAWYPQPVSVGPVAARAIPDGPDEHFEALKLVLLGALAAARRSVCVVTPYFLPDQALIHALNVAALRGVSVDIVLPARGNLLPVQWAAHTLYWQLIERGCRIWHSPPPFDHSKLMLVDDEWVLLGSTNWDPRSLRLNFELNVECYDPMLGRTLREWFNARLAASQAVTQAQMDGLPLVVRLRNGAARLLTPYL